MLERLKADPRFWTALTILTAIFAILLVYESVFVSHVPGCLSTQTIYTNANNVTYQAHSFAGYSWNLVCKA